jgi:membrane fusion protein (multidrug efflux system)
MKRIVVGIVTLAVVAVVVVRIVQASRPAEPTLDVTEIRQQAGIPVEVAQATVGPLEVRRSFTGTVRGIRSATVRARTADQILEIPVRVGQRVAEGEVVLRQSSQGSQSSVLQAEAAHAQAVRTVERLRPLHEQGAISNQDWDNAQTALSVAEANLQAARRAIVLTSPIDGVVTDILETPGSFPGSGDPLMRISDLSRVQVLLGVSPGQREELRVGQRALLPARVGEGAVTRIALQADPETRLIEVEVTFPGSVAATGNARRGDSGSGTSGEASAPAAPPLVPSTLATVELVVGARDSTLTIPAAALQDGSVWVLDAESVAHARPVRVGLQGNGSVEILEGLEAGDQVVTAGASLLSDGVRTRVVGG